MLLVGIEPSPDGGGLAGFLGIPFEAYPAAYALRLAVTIALVAWRWRSIRPWLGRPSWWPPLLGLALVVPWVGLAGLQRESDWQGWLFGLGARAAFDPFAAWGAGSATAVAWLVVRGLGLVVVIPLVEELFLRGFLMRYVVDEDFRRVPFGLLTPAAAVACAVWAISSHPAEAGAALGWFAVVTGIAATTRRPIDCILAHAATNLALGAWVLATGQWWLV
jgi:CAAX prenyl protease-like protein